MVIVTTGGNYYNERAMDFLQMIIRDLVPGVGLSANNSASRTSAIHPDKE